MKKWHLMMSNKMKGKDKVQRKTAKISVLITILCLPNPTSHSRNHLSLQKKRKKFRNKNNLTKFRKLTHNLMNKIKKKSQTTKKTSLTKALKTILIRTFSKTNKYKLMSKTKTKTIKLISRSNRIIKSNLLIIMIKSLTRSTLNKSMQMVRTYYSTLHNNSSKNSNKNNQLKIKNKLIRNKHQKIKFKIQTWLINKSNLNRISKIIQLMNTCLMRWLNKLKVSQPLKKFKIKIILMTK